MARRVWVSLVIGLALCGCGDGSERPSFVTAALVWEEQYDGGSDADRDRDIAYTVTACGERVFAAGETGPDDSGNDSFLIRAYEASSGTLLWQDRVQTPGHDAARQLVCNGGSVYAIALTRPVAIVRAYDAQTGRVLWTYTLNNGSENDLYSITVTNEAVFVFGVSYDPMRDPVTMGEVRALETGTGDLLWQQNHSLSAPWAYGTVAAIDDTICLVEEWVEASQSRAIRCFDTKDGMQLWMRLTGTVGQEHTAHPAFSQDGRTVVVAGTDADRSFVRAYDVASGRERWTHDYRPITHLADIETHRSRFLVAGTEFIPAPNDPDWEEDVFFASALDVDTGQVVWEQKHLRSQVRSAVLQNDLFVVAGTEWEFRVYDAQDGRLLLDEPAKSTPPSRWMWSIAADQARIFLAGAFFASSTGPRDYDFGVRTYKITPH